MMASRKVDLLFKSKNEFSKWCTEQEKWLDGELRHAKIKYKKPHCPPQALIQHDLRSLYRLHGSKATNHAHIIPTKEILIKHIRLKTNRGKIPLLVVDCQKEKQILLIKNELMFHGKQHKLPSKESSYKPYIDMELEASLMKMKITLGKLICCSLHK